MNADGTRFKSFYLIQLDKCIGVAILDFLIVQHPCFTLRRKKKGRKTSIANEEKDLGPVHTTNPLKRILLYSFEPIVRTDTMENGYLDPRKRRLSKTLTS